MNNNIVFDNDNNSDSNAELLKNNTPNTVDYNSLYNSKNNANINNVINQTNNMQNQNMNNNTSNIATNNNILNMQTPIDNQDINNTKKKKGMDSLLFVFLLFIIIMGIILFLFPLLSKYLLG